jgi:CheY-like chemotaxis protein
MIPLVFGGTVLDTDAWGLREPSSQDVPVSILIVEDEAPIRAVLTEILEDEGYPVVSVSNGLQALAYLRSYTDRPRLILLDLGMPVMSGWEFREEQQRDGTIREIPVIIMSALPDLDRRAAALGVAGCLDKPIGINALLGMVAQYYPLRSRDV